MKKLGLVLEGGGVRGAYTAGALAWLTDHDLMVDYGVGISSGAVYLCGYFMKNKDASYRMATDYAADKNNVGIRALIKEKHYVALNYLFDGDLLEKEKFDIQPLIDANPDMEIGAYDLNQGKTIWFRSKDLDPGLKIVRGACALPVASETVCYKDYRLVDGGITKLIPIERAVEQECTNYLVITTKPKEYVRKPSAPAVRWLMKVVYKDCPQIEKDYEVRHLRYYEQLDLVNDLVEQKKAVHVRPSQNIPVNRWKGDKENCEKLYWLGYQDMEDCKEEIIQLFTGESDDKTNHE